MRAAGGGELGAARVVCREPDPLGDEGRGQDRAIEAQMMPRLLALATRAPQIAEVRGSGAMLAIELVRPGSLEPDAAEAARIARGCAQRGVLVLTCGTFGNVLRFLPPLVIGADLLGDALDVLDDVVTSRG